MGEYMKTEVFNFLGKLKASWEVDVYDGAFQAHKDMSGLPTVVAGDRFKTTCAFNNKKHHGKYRVWGFNADDEMCMDWVYFYSDDNEVVSKLQSKDAGNCGFGSTPDAIAQTEIVQGLQDLTAFGQP